MKRQNTGYLSIAGRNTSLQEYRDNPPRRVPAAYQCHQWQRVPNADLTSLDAPLLCPAYVRQPTPAKPNDTIGLVLSHRSTTEWNRILESIPRYHELNQLATEKPARMLFYATVSRLIRHCRKRRG